MEPRKSFLLRISASVWREIEAWAQEDFRSVNGQIEYLLRQALVQRRRARLRSDQPPEDLRSEEEPAGDRIAGAEGTAVTPEAEGGTDLEVGRQD